MLGEGNPGLGQTGAIAQMTVKAIQSTAVAAPGEFLGFLETGQPSHHTRHVTCNAVRETRLAGPSNFVCTY